MSTRPIFRSVWWVSNALLILALLATAWCGVWEYAMRRYLRGFSDAVVPRAVAPQQKVEAIRNWMKNGPPRLELRNLNELSPRDPQNLRIVSAWVADHRLRIPRFHLRTNLTRATAAFFSTPEIK